jgi:hypothetical protein
VQLPSSSYIVADWNYTQANVGGVAGEFGAVAANRSSVAANFCHRRGSFSQVAAKFI